MGKRLAGGRGLEVGTVRGGSRAKVGEGTGGAVASPAWLNGLSEQRRAVEIPKGFVTISEAARRMGAVHSTAARVLQDEVAAGRLTTFKGLTADRKHAVFYGPAK